MVRLTIRFDGKVLVPEQPVRLPEGIPLQVVVETPGEDESMDAIADLAGLGQEVWAGIDPVQYQHHEREGWN